MSLEPHTLAFWDQNATNARVEVEAMLTSLIDHKITCPEPLCPGTALKEFFEVERPAEIWRILLIAALSVAAQHITLTDGTLKPWTPDGIMLGDHE